MDLENFSEQTKIKINASFNYARENNFAYFIPLHLLLILIKNDDLVKNTLKYFKVDIKLLLEQSLRISNKEKKHTSPPEIQGNLILLLQEANKKNKIKGNIKIETNLILLELCSDLSPTTKELLEKNNLFYHNLEAYIGEILSKEKNNFESIEKYTVDLTDLSKKNKVDPIIGREAEIKRAIQILSRRTKNNPILIGDPGVGKTAIAEGISNKIIEKQVPEGIEKFTLLSLNLSSLLSGTKFRGEFEERIKNLVNEIEEHSNIILFIDEIHTIIGTGSNEGSLDIANILKPALARGKLHCIGATTLAEYRKYFEKDAALSRRFQPIYIDEPGIEDTISILRGLKEKYEIHHGISISDNAIIASAKLSARYITSRKLPDKAIDLIDEAASKRRIELKAKPLPAEKLESKILKNKIEIENLIKDNPEDTQRIKTLKEENNNYEKELNKTLNQWNLYKSKIDKLNSYKETLEKNKTLLKTAKRIGDLTLAGKLTHYEIPQTEDFINKLEDSSKTILEDKKVRENDIADIISIWTGVPVNKILENEKKSLINLNSILHERVIGQQKAIEAISSVIKRSRVGINDPKKPIGSFLFLGPTGVGKTEVAKTLAEYLFKNEDELLTFDMSEYTEKHTISKLIGAPPGYIGFENGGRLTKEVKERPFKVILFDEIEKAHPEIFNIFLQILDEGRLMDSEGNYIDFKNTILILTSNIGSEEIINIVNKEDRDKKIEKKINNFFKPEFLNRLDDIIYFNKLDKKNIKLIIKNQLSILQNRLKSKSLKVVFDNRVIDMLIEKGYSDNYGARPLKRIIEKEIGDILADEILYDKIKPNKHLEIKVENGQFKITY